MQEKMKIDCNIDGLVNVFSFVQKWEYLFVLGCFDGLTRVNKRMKYFTLKMLFWSIGRTSAIQCCQKNS